MNIFIHLSDFVAMIFLFAFSDFSAAYILRFCVILLFHKKGATITVAPNYLHILIKKVLNW